MASSNYSESHLCRQSTRSEIRLCGRFFLLCPLFSLSNDSSENGKRETRRWKQSHWTSNEWFQKRNRFFSGNMPIVFLTECQLKKAITVIGCWCCCHHRFYLSAIAHRNRIGKFWVEKKQRSPKPDENVFSLHHRQCGENGKGHLKKLHTNHR